MDKPPARKKRSARVEEAPDELDARLVQLAQDAWAAYFRDRTEENLRRAQLLFAIGFFPERRRELAQHERELAGKEARTNPKHPDKFWRKVWVTLVRQLADQHKGEPAAVARDLIVLMPATLSAKVPRYPTNEAELEAAVEAVVAERNFVPELVKCRSQGPWNPLLVARAVFRGLGMTADEAKNLARKTQWEAWLREQDAI